MKYLVVNYYFSSRDKVNVILSNQANVKLMDFINYSNYKCGKAYTYYGGLQLIRSLDWTPPYPGWWYVIIDLGGYAGSVAASAKLIKAC